MRVTPLLAGLWVAACSAEESTSIEESALHAAGVFPDPDSPEANVDVRALPYTPGGEISNCTGTLITPQIVLTANHCFTGYAPEGKCHPAHTNANIIIGNNIVRTTDDTCPDNVCSPRYSSAAVLLRSGWDNCQND